MNLVLDRVALNTYHSPTYIRNSFLRNLGSYHFLPGGGGRLSVTVGRQFFVVPPLHTLKKKSGPQTHRQIARLVVIMFKLGQMIQQ